MDTYNFKRIVIITFIAMLCFVIGVLIGYFSMKKEHLQHCQAEHKVFVTPEKFNLLNRAADGTVTQKISELVSTARLDETLRFLTLKPNYAGTPNQAETAKYVHNEFLKHGIYSEKVTYNVLLAYPRPGANSTVTLLGSNDEELYRTSPYEINVDNDPNNMEEGTYDEFKAFNAYSPSGIVEGDLIFAEYGRKSDFEKLRKEGVDISGKIALIKYGKIFRGNKVQFAAEAGAVGVILFSDPKDYGVCCGGLKPYPHSIYLPNTGMQRGNIVLQKGDQTTPGYPSTEYAYRLNENELKARLPPIPSQPITAVDAYRLLSEIEGQLNSSYPKGRWLKPGLKVRLEVRNINEIRPAINVIGKIKGEIEPDRYVIIGGHRDAYVYGATDPMSGVNVLIEVARIIGLINGQGWKPRRSILFCSWDAEEYGLVGSYEWVEDNMKWLKDKTVAYINIDSGVAGNQTIRFQTVPLLKKVFVDSTKVTTDPKGIYDSVYEMWIAEENGKLKTYPMGGGSDFVPFLAVAGIPAMYARFHRIENPQGTIKWSHGSTPLYHSRHETYKFFKMIDPEMKFSAAITSILVEVIRNLADSVILPFDLMEFVNDLETYVESIEETVYSGNTTIDTRYRDGLRIGLHKVEEAISMLENSFNTLDKNNPLAVRRLNNKLMALEKVFIDDNGLPDRPYFKHLLRSPSSSNYYGGSSFPGISILNAIYTRNNTETNKRSLEKHLSVIVHTLLSIAKVIED